MLFRHKHHYHGPSSSSSPWKCLVSPPNLAMTTQLQRQAKKIHDILRRHILTFSTVTPCPLWQLSHPPSQNRHPSAIDNKQRLRLLVNRHLSANDIPAVVRAVAFYDILCDITPDVLECLQSNHTPAQSNT